MKKGDYVRVNEEIRKRGRSLLYGIEYDKYYVIDELSYIGGKLEGFTLKGVPLEQGKYFIIGNWEVCKEAKIKQLLKLLYEENS